MTRRLIASVGCMASISGAAAAQGDRAPLRLQTAIEVSPQRVAQVRMENGTIVRTSEWMEYAGGVARGPTDDLVFDCIEQTGTCGGGGLWFFGTGYCNGFWTNDMTLHPDTFEHVGLGRVDLAWFWDCNAPPGSGQVEDCEILVFTQESVPCEPDSFDYSGWILDFGSLSCNPGAYYYSNVDLMGGTWVVPTGLVGSYFMQYTTSDGAAFATCAQPMLWGTGDARGDPDAPGTQGPMQYDDDAPLDGSHTSLECTDYSLGECPDPLGGAAGFWGELADDCDFADCDDNDVIDTRDFACFFNRWVPKDDAADCDGNGVIDTRDVTCFLNQWAACR